MAFNEQQVLDELRQEWAALNVAAAGWFAINWSGLDSGVVFLLKAVDDLVRKLGVTDSGVMAGDKKSSIMTIIDLLYDDVVAPMFPIWLKPFSGIIKKIIVDTIIADLVDFLVSKYGFGVWKK